MVCFHTEVAVDLISPPLNGVCTAGGSVLQCLSQPNKTVRDHPVFKQNYGLRSRRPGRKFPRGAAGATRRYGAADGELGGSLFFCGLFAAREGAEDFFR